MASDLLSGLLNRDYKKRLTLQGIEQHEWYSNGGKEVESLSAQVEYLSI